MIGWIEVTAIGKDDTRTKFLIRASKILAIIDNGQSTGIMFSEQTMTPAAERYETVKKMIVEAERKP